MKVIIRRKTVFEIVLVLLSLPAAFIFASIFIWFMLWIGVLK